MVNYPFMTPAIKKKPYIFKIQTAKSFKLLRNLIFLQFSIVNDNYIKTPTIFGNFPSCQEISKGLSSIQ